MTSNTSFTACKAIQERLKEDYRVLHSWIAIGRKYNVSPAMAWRIANEGYEPKDDVIRDKLGFPQIIKQTVYRNKHGRFRKGDCDA